MILGPSLAGIVFERIAPPAPYALGAVFALAALVIVTRSERQQTIRDM